MCYKHPIYYTLYESLKFKILGRFTPAHASAFWMDVQYGKCVVSRFPYAKSPFVLQKAILNQQYVIDCVMLGPFTLLLQINDDDDDNNHNLTRSLLGAKQPNGTPLLMIITNVMPAGPTAPAAAAVSFFQPPLTTRLSPPSSPVDQALPSPLLNNVDSP